VALILEVLDPRTREVRTRTRLDALPLALGRSLDNDLVLDDPYVDARHARIATDESGALVLEDLGTLNGLVASDSPGRTNRLLLRPRLEVRVGRTTLRFRDSAEPVPAALPDVSPQAVPTPWPRRWLASRWGQLAAVAAATAAIAARTWLQSYDRETASNVLAAGVVFLLLAAMWAGIWAVASRIVFHRFRFAEHLAVVSAVALALAGLVVAGEWAEFLFPDNMVSDPLQGLVVLALIAVLITEHVALASTMTRGRCWRAGLGTCAVVLLLGAVATLVERDSFSDVPTFASVLKPLRPAWLPTGSVDDFQRAAADLKEQVDALASK
jgi:hypothetical protein